VKKFFAKWKRLEIGQKLSLLFLLFFLLVLPLFVIVVLYPKVPIFSRATPVTPPSTPPITSPVSPIPTDIYIPGDANGDGKVNGNDFTAWLRNFHPTDPVSGGVPAGDFNEDGYVNGNDFTIWLRNFDPFH
jgi:hypothetical protein